VNDTAKSLRELRDRQLSQGLKVLSIVGLVFLLMSLSRVLAVGWKPVMTLHLVAYAIFVGIAFTGRQLPFVLRASVVAAICFVLGVGGLLTWGIGGMGGMGLFVCCVLVTLFFGTRAGIVAAVLSTLTVITIGLLVGSGRISLSCDPAVYATSHISWISASGAMALLGSIIIRVIGGVNRELGSLAEELGQRNHELLGTIDQLQTEMAERARAEGERRILEERLVRAKRMEDLGTLAGGVAHDLNNILVGAVSYPDLLLTRLPADSPLREPIETIRRSGEKAAAIVQDLLTLARRGVASRDVVSLNAVIKEYFWSPEYERLKEFHPNVEVKLFLDDGLPNLSGSHIHLLKAVMNLVSNAAEAMPEGGTITVSTTTAHIPSYTGSFEMVEGGSYVVLKVSDTGTGILKSDVERIFEPFFTKKVMGRSGTGLGMSVVWGTVKDHGGYVDTQSDTDQGTTFTLYFPPSTEKCATIPARTTVKRAEVGESILIIDDVEEQRLIVSKMLSELGYSVDTVSSGEEAVSYLRRRAVDLLLLDMCMEPGMDGLDTYREILKVRPGQKVIIASGYSETDRLKEALDLGAGAAVRKPFLFDTIAVAVRTELDRKDGEKTGG
jgi:signal transduction histidine kinase/ActR/RegA family two-component response regulator